MIRKMRFFKIITIKIYKNPSKARSFRGIKRQVSKGYCAKGLQRFKGQLWDHEITRICGDIPDTFFRHRVYLNGKQFTTTEAHVRHKEFFLAINLFFEKKEHTPTPRTQPIFVYSGKERDLSLTEA